MRCPDCSVDQRGSGTRGRRAGGTREEAEDGREEAADGREEAEDGREEAEDLLEEEEDFILPEALLFVGIIIIYTERLSGKIFTVFVRRRLKRDLK